MGAAQLHKSGKKLTSAKAKTKKTNKKPHASLLHDSRNVTKKCAKVPDNKVRYVNCVKIDEISHCESEKTKIDCRVSRAPPKTLKLVKATMPQIAGKKRKPAGFDDYRDSIGNKSRKAGVREQSASKKANAVDVAQPQFAGKRRKLAGCDDNRDSIGNKSRKAGVREQGASKKANAVDVAQPQFAGKRRKLAGCDDNRDSIGNKSRKAGVREQGASKKANAVDVAQPQFAGKKRKPAGLDDYRDSIGNKIRKAGVREQGASEKANAVDVAQPLFAGKKRKPAGLDDYRDGIEKKRRKTGDAPQLKSKSKNETKWTIGGKGVDPAPFDFPNISNYPQNMSAADYFELFFDDAIVEMIMSASSEYCSSKNLPDIKLSKVELRAFFGILILSGYNRLPGKPMYWSSDKDLGNEAVAETMRRDRFDNIMRSLHFVSNDNLDCSDKFAKLRPLIKHLQKKFMRNFSPTDEAISHDEAMVEYFGNHGCKQAIRDKPIRFGYKFFCQNTPSGYLIAFNPYQGKTFEADEEMEAKFGKSASSLLHILDSYPLNKSEYPYHFYCDNYFTSIPLLSELKNRGYNCTGTIRADRVGKDCPLMDVKKFKKQRRGYSEVATAHHLKNKIFLNRWKDNSAVTVASTCYATNPEASVKRWCKVEKKRIDVPIPHAIHKYNRNMGGTDRTDQNINNYRISIRGKKWWWSMFTWMLDASVQNAWCLARKANPKLTQLRFRRKLVKSYLSAHTNPRKDVGRKRPVSDGYRFDRLDHYPRKTCNNKQRRCAGKNCKSSIRQECSKCNVGLCIACFQTYHTVV